jgi:hypothetical protein
MAARFASRPGSPVTAIPPAPARPPTRSATRRRSPVARATTEQPTAAASGRPAVFRPERHRQAITTVAPLAPVALPIPREAPPNTSARLAATRPSVAVSTRPAHRAARARPASRPTCAPRPTTRAQAATPICAAIPRRQEPRQRLAVGARAEDLAWSCITKPGSGRCPTRPESLFTRSFHRATESGLPRLLALAARAGRWRARRSVRTRGRSITTVVAGVATNDTVAGGIATRLAHQTGVATRSSATCSTKAATNRAVATDSVADAPWIRAALYTAVVQAGTAGRLTSAATLQ